MLKRTDRVERLDAARRVAREAFNESALTVADVKAAVRKVRRNRQAVRGTKQTASGGLQLRWLDDLVANGSSPRE